MEPRPLYCRIAPMNSDPARALEERLKRLHIREEDLSEHFVRSGGHGGQNVNKVSTCVILTHLPTGTTVRCEEERSQARNRFLARRRLADRLEALAQEKLSAARQAVERARRRARRPSKAARARNVADKRHRSDIKRGRKGSWRDE